MDSHESSENFTKTTAVETVPIQDSPVFSNIANLSPAQPFNVPPRTQSLIRLNCPRRLFMSPQARAPHQTSLVRTNYPELSGATISAQDEGCNYSLPFVSGSKNDRIEHSSADPDKFLNMDFLDPNNSSSFATKQSEHIDQPPDDVSGKEIVLKLGHKYNTRVKEATATFAPHAFINQDTEDSMTEAFQHHGMHRSYLQFEDAQHKLKPDWHSEIHVDGEVARSLSLTRQQDAFNTIQSISYPKRYLNPTSTMSITKPSSSGLDMLKRHSQINLEWEGPRSLVWTTQKTPINTIQPISYPGQYLNPTPTMGITEPSSSGLQKYKTNWHPQIHLDGEWARSLSLARKQTPSNTIQPISYPKQYLNPTPTMSITKPSSSGLHLNNLFNSGATMNGKSAPMGSFSMQGGKSKPLFNSVAKSLLRESTLLSAYLTNSSTKSIVLNPRKDQSTQGGKNKRNTENVGDEEEFYSSSPKQERKRISESSHGAIRCQCKKIKCVKLYCDCFGAGLYCAETCSCQGCLNQKKYDDEVLEARELIESRNPLAFAPKVVHHSIKPSASGHGEDGTRLTPSSARHIRGCNCKKSMCLKRYCECYQSKVGCSDGCNCEGCRNIYGQKEDASKTHLGVGARVLPSDDFTITFDVLGQLIQQYGTIDQLFGRSVVHIIAWGTRLKIAIGAAKGLAFLNCAEKPVIYRDFKTSNVLLDSDFNAKLSDFGLAKMGLEGSNTYVTTRVMGTYGYAAPEYVSTGHLTTKSDIYSFGVVLLELLTGRRAMDKKRPKSEQNLVDWARPYLTNSRRLRCIMDPRLAGRNLVKGAKEMGLLAQQCVSLNPKDRPKMPAIIETLESLQNLKDIAVSCGQWPGSPKTGRNVGYPNRMRRENRFGCKSAAVAAASRPRSK